MQPDEHVYIFKVNVLLLRVHESPYFVTLQVGNRRNLEELGGTSRHYSSSRVTNSLRGIFHFYWYTWYALKLTETSRYAPKFIQSRKDFSKVWNLGLDLEVKVRGQAFRLRLHIRRKCQFYISSWRCCIRLTLLVVHRKVLFIFG